MGLITFTFFLICAALYGVAFSAQVPLQKLLNTLSVAFGLASIIQLKSAGWFEAVAAEYFDESKYPYGPPSIITRQIIDNPDSPWLSYVRNYFFYDANFGASLAVASLLVAGAAIWVD